MVSIERALEVDRAAVSQDAPSCTTLGPARYARLRSAGVLGGLVELDQIPTGV
jgi:hypothetical protein